MNADTQHHSSFACEDSKMPSNPFTREVLLESDCESRNFTKVEEIRHHNDTHVPFIALNEFRQILMSERKMFQQQMQQMMTAQALQNNLIYGLKVGHIMHDYLRCGNLC